MNECDHSLVTGHDYHVLSQLLPSCHYAVRVSLGYKIGGELVVGVVEQPQSER